MRVSVSIPDDLIERCRAFALAVVDGYQRGLKEASRTLVVEGREPIWANERVQFVGRVCEVAVALYLKCDPAQVLDWSPRCDDGADLKYLGWRIDVKGSDHPKAALLIWPLSKKRFLVEARADVFVAVQWLNADRRAELFGCVNKSRFIREHRKADGWSPRGLVLGTPYMREGDLDPPNLLHKITQRSARA